MRVANEQDRMHMKRMLEEERIMTVEREIGLTISYN
jgi:hypothetical protein